MGGGAEPGRNRQLAGEPRPARLHGVNLRHGRGRDGPGDGGWADRRQFSAQVEDVRCWCPFPRREETDYYVPATEASYAGAVPGLVAGLLQVNVRVPESLPDGNWLLELWIWRPVRGGDTVTTDRGIGEVMGGSMFRSMCCSFGFFLVALGAGIATRPMQGQTMSFFREFSTPQMDRASAIAADATGVYLFGDRPSPDRGLGSAGVTKFDSRGKQLWTRPFSAPAGEGLQFISVASEPTGIYALAVAGDFAQCFIRKSTRCAARRSSSA